MTSNASLRIILITGEPGVGKTTLVKKLFERLNNYPVSGFYTEEVRNEANIRIGFDVIDISQRDKKSPLARIKELNTATSLNSPQVGKYVVDVQSFEKIALENIKLMDSSKLYIIDEIGKMEMFSFSFEKAMVELLKNIEKNNFLVLATVPLKSLKLSDMFKTNSRSKIYTINRENRNKIDAEIYQTIKESLNEISKFK